jgi:hypothetical protein
MKYPIYDMYDQQFELMVIYICQKILGMGLKNFTQGRDGGRDGKFSGTAEAFPSRANALSGIFIVQAKHTNDPTAKFTDTDFISDAESSVLSKEIPRIKALVEAGECQHYILFS